jgi:hypothetical protein
MQAPVDREGDQMEKQARIDEEEVRKSLDRFYGKGLFKTDKANFCYRDGYYALSLKQRYGMDIEELAKKIGYDTSED